jgi:hypothetical protein
MESKPQIKPDKPRPTSTGETTKTTQDLKSGKEIEQLIANWRQIVNEAPASIKKATAAAILRSADVKPIAIEDGTVILASKYEFYKEQLGKAENQKVAAEIISKFLGHSCQVRCIHKPEGNHLLKAAVKLGAKVVDVEEK